MHYLHLKNIDNETDIYYKDMDTCQYMQFFLVTYPGISKQHGLKHCIIQLRKYIVIRNYYILNHKLLYTLVLIKESDIDNVLSKLNSFSQV